ncbi:uncharacterized protein LOC110443648 isoform X2 [Mizuhopecten yessoensis]|uniref:uncharacterized protein LOC110443648 isoform X2 n=1 Tax=Mizuhopecten yessoensis TaxID=6573 RepID=UPI000B4598A2|nr:uncharacterized protein LOC110443648 isoform X2 [Mizuhopecten yessoensis]
MLDEQIILVHPDGRTQSVKEYVHELVKGAQVRLYDGKDYRDKRKHKTGGISKTKHKITNSAEKPEAVRFQETWIDDDEDVRNADSHSGARKGSDDRKQGVGACAGDPLSSSHVTSEGACGPEDVNNDHEESEAHGGWAFLSRLLAVRSALMRATTRRPSQSSEGDEEKRSIADFFRKRKSTDNTFTTEEKDNEACAKPHNMTPSPKKQKTRLMSDDSGIAVDIPRRDSEIRNQRLARFRNSIRNFISCSTTSDNVPTVEPAEPSEI